jgi:hypothetical protein
MILVIPKPSRVFVSKMWFADAKPWYLLPCVTVIGKRPSIGLDAAKSFASRIDANPGMVGDELDPAPIARQPIDKLLLWVTARLFGTYQVFLSKKPKSLSLPTE